MSGRNLRNLKSSWKKSPPAREEDFSGSEITKSGKSVRTSISIDSAVWEAAGDLAHELNKETKPMGIKGGFVVSRLTTVALQYFHSLPRQQQLELIRRFF